MSSKFPNTTSDFLEWDTILNLVRKLYNDQNYKISLLIACGCFFGLRISDLLSITWKQLLICETFEIIEKKTGKKRIIKINSQLQKHIQDCFEKINPSNTSNYCFMSQKDCANSIQRVNVILKEVKLNTISKSTIFQATVLESRSDVPYIIMQGITLKWLW